MFYSLKGILTYIDDNIAVVECSGVGYKCNITLTTKNDLLNLLNKEVMIYTHLNVREDAITLFGFSQKFELDCFKILTTVSGVGAKVGITILSSLDPEQIIMAISSGNAKILTCAPGVGPKLAQRIVLELKDKVSKLRGISSSSNLSLENSFSITQNMEKASEALTALGYSVSDVNKTLSKLDGNASVEELIKSALKIISRRT